MTRKRALSWETERRRRLSRRGGELLPCPKCGDNKEVSIATATRIFREFWGTCWACGFCGPIELSVSKAIESWNHRAPLLTPTQMALLGIVMEPKKLEVDVNVDDA